MEKTFVYGMSVGGSNFTDRIEETKRIKLDFENGVNVILTSPRRMGKTSLIKKVISEVDNPMIKIVYMDIYDCRSEYDFYNRFAETIMRSTGNHAEQVIENIKRFLVRVSPKLSFSPEPNSEFSVSLGITPKNYSPEEILNLPERIAQEQGVRMVVCIDEFQQIGEFTDSLTIQKRLRGAWQHHQNVSYCFFGSKKHLMENIFQSRRMPFYQFGEMTHLKCIPTEYWVPFICSRFEKYGKKIGIHAHDNLKLAYANTVEAMRSGASMLDGTVSCMGRGAGNCALELLLGFLRNPKYNLYHILKFIEQYMVPIKAKGDAVWGYDVPYMLTGMLNQHPREAIDFIKNERHDYADMYSYLMYRE